MVNKKRVTKALIIALFMAAPQVVYAKSPVNHLHLDPYRCSSAIEPLQRVHVNLGGRRGFVQLDVPVTNSQPVSISLLKQCLLNNGLMSKEELSAYTQALEICRRAHYQQKAQFSRGEITNLSTSKTFNFDHCLQNNLLN